LTWRSDFESVAGVILISRQEQKVTEKAEQEFSVFSVVFYSLFSYLS